MEWRAGYYESRVTHKSGGQAISYVSRVTHKSFIGDELIGGKAVNEAQQYPPLLESHL